MLNTLKNKKKGNSGYILLESVIAFSMITLVILTFFPLLSLLLEKQQQQTVALESYRYCYEMAREYVVTQQIECSEKTSARIKMKGRGSYNEKEVKGIEVETEGAQVQIYMLEKGQ